MKASLVVVIFWSLVVVCLGRGQWVPKRYIKDTNPTTYDNFGSNIHYSADGGQFATTFSTNEKNIISYFWEKLEYISNCNKTSFPILKILDYYAGASTLSILQTPTGHFWIVSGNFEPQLYKSTNCEFITLELTLPGDDYPLVVLPKHNPGSRNTYNLLLVQDDFFQIVECDPGSNNCSQTCYVPFGMNTPSFLLDKTGRWLIITEYPNEQPQANLYDLNLINYEGENLTIDDIKTNLIFDTDRDSAIVFGRKFFAVSYPYSGIVNIYSLDELSLVETLTENNTANFGTSLAFSDNFLVVGAPYSENESTDKVFVYKIVTNGDTTTFSLSQVLLPSMAGLGCGSSVAINAGVILVGCPYDSTSFPGIIPIMDESHLYQMLDNTSSPNSGSIILYSLDCDEGITINRGFICSPNSSNVVLTFESENVTFDFPLTIRNSILEIPRNVRNIYTPGLLLSEMSTISLTVGTQITTDSCAELNGTLELFLPNVTKSSIDGTRFQIVNFNCTTRPTGFKTLEIKRTEETGSAEECGGLVGTPEYSNINMGVLFSVDYSECGGESSDSNDALLIGLVVGLVGGCILLVIIVVLVFVAITYFIKKKEEARRRSRNSEMIQF